VGTQIDQARELLSGYADGLMIFRSGDPRTNFESLGLLDGAMAALGRTGSWIDDDGYEHEIIAGAVHPSTSDVAWIEHREKELVQDGRPWVDVSYTLRIQRSGTIAIDVEVPTYNPFFGCYVLYFAWHGEQVVGIYREKHKTCVCAMGTECELEWRHIDDEWRVDGDLLRYRGAELMLPSLKAVVLALR
jgi:hypothetical protein